MPHIRWRAFAAAFAVLLAAGSMQPGSADAQGIFKRIKKQAKEKAAERVVQRAGQATDKALDKTEGAIVCVA